MSRSRPQQRGSLIALSSRGRSLLGVCAGVALLVSLNGLVRHGGAGSQFVGAPSLPVVQLDRPSAWRCPGPLPVGTGPESSSVAIVNTSGSATTVTVTVTRTGLPAGGVVTGASVSTSRVKLDAESEAMVALPTKGPAGFAAVSVDSDGNGIGAAELIRGASGKQESVAPSSPCTLGAAPAGYVPAGSTAGTSDVRLSLYDPDATPAVVNVSVSNGAGLSSPPAFQGVVVPADGLAVLDLRRWVFQLGSMAVTASAVSGDIVVGALETTSATMSVPSGSTTSSKILRVHFTGTSLLVGPDRGLARWAFTDLQSRIGVSSTFSVYDPGSKPILVTVAPPGPGGLVAALTENVPAGGIVDFATPIAPGTRLGAKSVVVFAGRGAAIVVARLTTRQRSGLSEELNSTSGTAGAAEAMASAGSDDQLEGRRRGDDRRSWREAARRGAARADLRAGGSTRSRGSACWPAPSARSICTEW